MDLLQDVAKGTACTNFFPDSFIETGYSTPAEVTLAAICACAATWCPLAHKIVEVTRSRMSSLRSSRSSNTFVDVEKNGTSSYRKSATILGKQSGRNYQVCDDDMLPLPAAHLGGTNQHGIFEAKQNGLPETKTGAYRSSSEQDNHEQGDGTSGWPLEGIQVKCEVMIEDGSTADGK